MLRKIFLSAAMLLLATGVALAASHELKGNFTPKTTGETLVKALANALAPESLEVILDSEPDEDGLLSRVYIMARGISARTEYRLDTFALSGALVKLTPPSKWDAADLKTFRPEKWEGIFNIEIVLKEEDARKAVQSFMAKNKEGAEKWRNLKIDFRSGSVFVKGNYDINSGMNAAFEISSGLELRGGKQIWLVDTNVQINNDEQTDAIRSEIKKINPPVDFADTEIPLTLRSLVVTDREIRVRTATVPKPIPGITYRYSK